MNIKEGPHHSGHGLWCIVDGRLMHKNKNETEWDEVSRVSYTPQRIKMIADLIYEYEDRMTREEMEDKIAELQSKLKQ